MSLDKNGLLEFQGKEEATSYVHETLDEVFTVLKNRTEIVCMGQRWLIIHRVISSLIAWQMKPILDWKISIDEKCDEKEGKLK